MQILCRKVKIVKPQISRIQLNNTSKIFSVPSLHLRFVDFRMLSFLLNHSQVWLTNDSDLLMNLNPRYI